jgi:bacillithiol biosynthesis cysteine-adding enzyme BshC
MLAAHEPLVAGGGMSASRLQAVLSAPARDAATRFLREHAEGAPLYPAGSFDAPAAVERRARKLKTWDGDRAALAGWLAEQNAADRIGSPHPAQAANLAAASRPDALFVLTGQQPGLLGGPALGLHKALTAVARAREAAALLQVPVIPVFWAAGDDSDLAESNAVEFLEPGMASSGSSGSASLEFADPEDAIPMSLRTLSAESLRTLREKFPDAWTPEVRAMAEACYASGRNLTEAFLRLMQGFLGPHGVLFVDGFAAAQRPEAQTVLRRVAANSAVFNESLLRGTARLRETLNLPAQVPVRPGTVPIFLFQNGRRERLFASDSGRVYVAGDEGADLRPALTGKVLLHSALTRPLLVDTLFPALGHVLGPAELRYFAQIADVFPAFERTFPLLSPRRQALVVTQADRRALEEIGVHSAEWFDLRPSKVREHLTAEAWKNHAAARGFPDADYQRFRETLGAYQDEFFSGGKVSGNEVARSGGGFENALRRLDRSFGNYREQARRLVFSESASMRFRALQPLLRWMAGGLQDRHLNLLSLRNTLGTEAFEAWIAHLAAPASPSAHSTHSASGFAADAGATLTAFVLDADRASAHAIKEKSE